MNPVMALERIAHLLEREHAPVYKSRAFRRAADALRRLPDGELERRVAGGSLLSIPGIGEKTGSVIEQALRGETPQYLERLIQRLPREPTASQALRQRLRGDCHAHTHWSDGRSSLEEMAHAAISIGHEYLVITDHSPRLKVARGLTPERLREQLERIAELNRTLAPFRLLTGIEVDILPDGSLDQEDSLLARLDVVVASVHSNLRSEATAMTERMITALQNPHVDVLGHCTGRIVVGRGRKESEFDAEAVFCACAQHDKAIEINCRPERLDPPKRLLAVAAELGCRFAVNTDAHAPGQLDWQHYGCDRALDCGISAERIINTWTASELLNWTGSHA